MGAMTRRDDADPRTPDEPTELGWGQEPTDAAVAPERADAEQVGAEQTDALAADGEQTDAEVADGEQAGADGTDAEHSDADQADETSDPRSMKTVPPALWVWFAALLLLVGGLAFIAGDRFGPGVGGNGVNLAGASAGSNDDGPVAKEDGTYDAGIVGPRAGAAIATMEDIAEVHRRDAADPFALGAVDAPVVMTMFSDFECPFCARYATDTQPNLIADYVDSGLLRIEWNDSAASGAAAQAAQAGRAAAAQGKFWEFQKAVFDAAIAKGNGHPEFTVDELVEAARTAGVEDIGMFEKQLKDGTWEKAVQESTAYAQSIGVQGTPQFVIGTTPISGALPEQTFRDNIELELMKAARAQQ